MMWIGLMGWTVGQAATLTVPSQYGTLTEAVNAASAGDTIEIRDLYCPFEEAVPVQIGKDLTIQRASTSAGYPVLPPIEVDCAATGTCSVVFSEVDFVVDACAAYTGACVDSFQADVTLTDVYMARDIYSYTLPMACGMLIPVSFLDFPAVSAIESSVVIQAGAYGSTFFGQGIEPIIFAERSTITVSDTFLSPEAGASIASSDSDVFVTDTDFSRSYSFGEAHVVATGNDSHQLSLVGSTFADFAATRYVEATGMNLTLDNSVFAGGSTGGSGGAVSVEAATPLGSVDVDITNAEFSDNTALDNGGALFLNHGGVATLTYTDASGSVDPMAAAFDNNMSFGPGGAIALVRGDLNISGGTFLNNFGASGGGIHVSQGTLTTDHSLFEHNWTNLTTQLDQGGAIALDPSGVLGGVTAVFTNTDFLGFPGEDDAGKGGCLSLNSGAIATVEGSFFQDCSAQWSGGAVYVREGLETVTLDIEGSDFRGNVAPVGAAVAALGPTQFTLNKSRLIGNITTDPTEFSGSTVLLDGPPSSEIEGNLFCGNNTLAGSSLIVRGGADSIQNIHHNIWLHEEVPGANLELGGTQVESALYTVQNNTFLNTTGSKFATLIDGDAAFTNNLFSQQGSAFQSAILGVFASNPGSSLAGSGYNLWFNIDSPFDGDVDIAAPLGDEALYDDPKFTALPPESACDGFSEWVDLMPTEDSPAVDSGDPSILDEDGSRSDRGAVPNLSVGTGTGTGTGTATGTGSDRDVDGDGFTSDVDCDDSDPSVYPGAVDVPNDGIDQDCDGFANKSWVAGGGTCSHSAGGSTGWVGLVLLVLGLGRRREHR